MPNEILEIDRYYGELYEEAVLFTPIGMEKNLFPDICEALTEEDFTTPEHKALFAHISKLTKAGLPPNDLVTLVTTLKEARNLNKAGGQTDIARKAFDNYLTVGLNQHIAKLQDYRRVRQLSKMISQLEVECKLGSPSDEIIDKFQSKLSQIEQDPKRETDMVVRLRDVLRDVVKGLESGGAPGKEPGIFSGLTDFDNLVGGFRPGELIVFAGRPGMGKSILVNDIVLESKATTLIFSLEMSRTELIQRMLSTKGRVSFTKIRKNNVSDCFGDIIKGANAINDLLVWIVAGKANTIEEISSIAKEQVELRGIDLIVIDYLQLIKTRQKANGREQEVSEISRSLKLLARELDVPVICVAQLNRQCEARTNKRPMISDLRESGAIEQDADLVAMIYREFIYSKNEADRYEAELSVEKGRNCPTGRVDLVFDGDHQTFLNRASDTSYLESL